MRRATIGLLLLSGCWSAKVEAPSVSAPARSTQDLIGGFAAADASLNAIGSMSLMYDDGIYSTFDLICSGSLLDPNTVVTAKHCIESVSYYSDYGYNVVFSIGPSTFSPLDWAEVVAVQGAPGDYGGFNGYGHDVAVLQLGAGFEGAPSLQIGSITDADIGKDFVGMGFGDRDNNENYGERRVGTLALRATSGRTYEVLLGSFPAFYEWFWGEPLPPECANVSSSGGPIVIGPVIEVPPIVPGPLPVAGSGGDDDAGAFVDCSIASYVRQIYDTTLLEEQSEVAVGGVPGNAQPCYGDSGSPLLRLNEANQLVAYGVVSGGLNSRTMICDYGAVYAGFNAEVIEFLEKAKSWVDPCKDMPVFSGYCEGSVARRCSTLAEGERRRLAFDCAAVDLSCEPQLSGGVGCGSDDPSFQGPAPARAGETPATPRSLLAPVFRKPAR